MAREPNGRRRRTTWSLNAWDVELEIGGFTDTKEMSGTGPAGGRGTINGTDVRRAVLLLVLIGIVLRLVLAGAIGLGVDESYAVSVSRGLSLSYFDHPPISFWIPGLLAKLMHSENRVLMRLPFILFFAGTTWLMYRLTARLFGERAGLYATLLLNVSPVFSVSTGGWVLPDGPLMFFMLAAGLCLVPVLVGRKDPDHATARWLGAGVLTGLALLSKYHGIFVAAGTFLFLITRRESRHWLRRPGPSCSRRSSIGTRTTVGSPSGSRAAAPCPRASI